MRIETIRVKNFKNLQDVELEELPPLCVFVGRNGTGKTTLFRIFAFLKNCLQYNVRAALNREGGRNGYREVVTRGHEGEDIEIEIQFRMDIAGTNRLITYLIGIGPTETGTPIVKREILRYKRGRYGAPFHVLDFTEGEGYAISNEEDFSKRDEELEKELQRLDEPHTLAIKGLGQFARFKAANAFRQLIENWHISDFHVSDARGVKDEDDTRHLTATGDNLPSMARYLYEQHRPIFDQVTEKMRRHVPGVDDIEVKVTEDGRLLMRYADGTFDDPFIDKNVSDGTIKMFSYLVLLHDPSPHPILCVEEPENQLYPTLMISLAEEFAAYAQRGGQVFVSTHSPDFLNAIELDEIFWLEKHAGTTRVHRAGEQGLLQRLVQEGDRPGYLWTEGFLDSRVLQESAVDEG